MVNSKETEISIIGSLLYDPTIFPKVYGIVKPEDFYNPVARYLFRSIVDLAQNKIEVNIQTLLNHLSKRNYEGITESELKEYLDYRVPADSVISFATQVSEFSGYRILDFELEKLKNHVKDRDLSLSEIVSQISTISHRINEKGVKQEFVTGAALVESYINMLSKDRSLLRLTGLKDVDDRLVDFDAKEVTYIAARPGTGKTALMLQSVRSNLESERRVGFISMEMDSSKILNRLISAKARFDGSQLLKMKPDEFRTDRKLMAALDWYKNKPLFIDDSGPFTSATIPQKVRKMVYEHGCEVVYVDYIGLINATGHLVSAPRNQQLTQISADLKGLASELNIPVVAASQLNRDVTKRTTGKPTLADLRDSGSLEQDASIVLFVYVDMNKFVLSGLSDGDVDDYIKDNDELYLRVEVGKQRNGSVFSESVVLEKPYGVFTLASEYNKTY